MVSVIVCRSTHNFGCSQANDLERDYEIGTYEFTEPVTNAYVNRRKTCCIKDSWYDNPMWGIDYPCSYGLLVMEWKCYKNSYSHYPKNAPQITSDMRYILLITGICFCNGATNSGQDRWTVRNILSNELRFFLLCCDGRRRVWWEIALHIELCNLKCNHELWNHKCYNKIMRVSV